jgi:diacylglycerol kinase family enzyme
MNATAARDASTCENQRDGPTRSGREVTTGLESAPLFIVLNVGSGKHDAAEVRREIEATLSALQRRFSVHLVESADDLAAIAKLAVDEARGSGGVVVAAGGDGTINAVAQATLGSGCAFGVLPLGTFNYFSRAHGIPSELAGACRVLNESSALEVQVGLVNDRIFLVNASIGLYPQLLEEREQAKAQLGRSRLVAFAAALRTLFTFRRNLLIEIASEQTKRSIVAKTLFLGNNRLQLERVGILESEQVEQHKLAVVTLAPVGVLGMLGLVARAIVGRLGDARHIKSFALEKLLVRSRVGQRRLKVATDGEVARMATPLLFRVAPHPLLLLRPKERREDPG